MSVLFQKAQHVREHVSMGQLLDSYGVPLREDQLKAYKTSQIPCPIHGVDNHKSAKFFESSNSFYCWTCSKVYSPIDLVMEKEGFSFAEAVNFLLPLSRVPFVAVDEISLLNAQLEKKSCAESSFEDRIILLDQKCRWIYKNGYLLSDAIRLFELIDNVSLSHNSVHLQKLEEVVDNVQCSR